MLYKVGLVQKDNFELADFAHEYYQHHSEKSFGTSAEFKWWMTRKVEVEFVGVWYMVSCLPHRAAGSYLYQGYRQFRWITASTTPLCKLEPGH